ncbi:MAG: iron ABC transporter permease [Actinobacteria bacterium]|nr:iron ABC transporter permease [Actinomycetota bacterium]
MAASLALGARDIPLGTVVEALLDQVPGDTDHAVVMEQRLPRTVVGILVGASLGMAGTLMQGITRNPLADPGILGVNAGASLAVIVAITLLGVTNPAGFAWFAFAGAAAAAVVVYAVGALGREGATPVKLALAGTALTAGVNSAVMLVLLSDPTGANAYRFWQVGSLAGRGAGSGADAVAALLPFLLLGTALAAVVARPLDLLGLGDDVARGLGVNLSLARGAVALAVVLLAGSATALGGPIAFVGLVVPHLVRPFTGPNHRWILVHAVLLGPALLLVADVVGRLVARPGEVEAGLVVAVVGAPVLIALVRRRKMAGL